jgi:hypothetical protein
MEAVELEVVEGYPTDVVGFGTDIPHFRFSGRVILRSNQTIPFASARVVWADAGCMQKAILWGAGSIRDAHGADEKIAIADLVQAVKDYKHIISVLATK